MKLTPVIKSILFAVTIMLNFSLVAQQDWQWARKGGSTSADYGQQIYADASGNSYVTGFFNGTCTFGTFTLTSAGSRDVFVAKYNKAGTIQWAKRFGGVKSEEGYGISGDGNGNCYITGFFNDSTIIGSDTIYSSGSSDIFIFKLNAVGNVMWTRKAGGTGSDYGLSICCDNSGFWLAGLFRATCYFDSIALVNGSTILNDYFIAKYDLNGSLQWAKRGGNSSNESMGDLAIDKNGFAYVTGMFYGQLILGNDTLKSKGPSGSDAFFVKYDQAGNPVWARSGGAYNNVDEGYSISVDDFGNVYACGNFSSSQGYFGSDTLPNSGNSDIFIVKFNAAGVFLWAKGIGNIQVNPVYVIRAQPSGEFYMTGSLVGTMTFDAFTLTQIGNDGYLVKYNTDGVAEWAKRYGGSTSTPVARPYDMALDASGDCYLTGYFNSTILFGTNSITTTGSSDVFVARLGCAVNPAAAAASTDLECYNDNSGTATVNISGGAAPYSVLWNSSPSQDSVVATGLSAGTYVVFVEDNNGCSVIDTAVLNQPAPIVLSTSASGLLCFGDSTGSAAVSASGGAGVFSYSWSTSPVQDSSTAVNLTAGNYIVIVEDSSGCSASDSVSVEGPAQITMVMSSSDVLCYGDSTGTAAAIASGGTGDYTFSWNTSPAQDSSTAVGLAAGNYVVMVEDSNGCSIMDSIAVGQPTLISLSLSSASTLCNGDSTGSASVIAAGGAGNFTYSWSTIPAQDSAAAINLPAGNYIVMVEDSNGCIVTDSIAVDEPPALDASVITVDALCNGDSNGSACVSITGGVGGYMIGFDAVPDSVHCFTGLSAGSYTTTIEDANGCALIKSFVINEPSVISVTVTTVDASNGACDGSAAASVSGGTPGYTYIWVGGQTTSSIANLCAGNYIVEVTDANNCVYTDAFVINTTTSVKEAVSSKEIKIYPNPVNETSVLHIPVAYVSKESIFEVYDLTGKLVKTTRISDEKMNIGKLHLNSGIYMYAVVVNGKRESAGRMIVE